MEYMYFLLNSDIISQAGFYILLTFLTHVSCKIPARKLWSLPWSYCSAFRLLFLCPMSNGDGLKRGCFLPVSPATARHPPDCSADMSPYADTFCFWCPICPVDWEPGHSVALPSTIITSETGTEFVG